MTAPSIAIRPATPADAPVMARLHSEGIAEGFLPSLGPKFLTRLYGRILRTEHAFAYVAGDRDAVVGFVAGALDISDLYRTFLVRDGVIAGLSSAPRIARSLPRVIETLRYPARSDLPRLPDAEILAVAVDAAHHGQGHGRALVEMAVREFERRGVRSIKVVAGADNAIAAALYRSCGFVEEHELRVHAEVASVAYVRAAPVDSSGIGSR